MLKKTYVWIILSVLIFASAMHVETVSGALTGFNQEEILRLSSVDVSLWPEFDRADMLVIYRINIPINIYLPVEVRLRIPAEAGTPNAVAAEQPNGALVTIPYVQQSDMAHQGAGEWSWIIFNAITPEIQVEYYDPGLIIDGVHRHFEYSWPGDYPVDNIGLEIQQPVSSKDMRIKPGMVTVQPGTDGLMYYQLNVGSVAAGQTFSIEVDYLKSNNKLSSGYIPVEPSGPLDDSTQGRMKVTSALPWILGSLGFLMILGGGLWYWRSGPIKTSLSGEPSLQDEFEGIKGENKEEGNTINCPVCGRRAFSGDRFCRSCGKQLLSNSR